MAQIGSVWAQPSWADDVWATGTWANAVTPPTPTVVIEPAGGGRRIYDPDEDRKKYEPLSKRERRELDRMFRERAAPRYVSPKPAVVVTKRVTPFVPLAVPGFEPPKPVNRIQAAKHFMALDAVESLFDRFEAKPQPKADHRAALEHAQQLHQRAEAEVARLAAERAEQARLAWDLAEQERLAAEDDEMMSVLLAIHELS